MNFDEQLEFDRCQRASIAAATKVIAWPAAVAYLLLLGMMLIRSSWQAAESVHPVGILAFLLISVVFAIYAVLIAGCFIGKFAQYWCWRSSVPVVTMSVVLALLYDSVIASWIVIVFTR